jgi:hypothetical protein
MKGPTQRAGTSIKRADDHTRSLLHRPSTPIRTVSPARGTRPPRAPRERLRGSGEIAADRDLDVQRLSLPLQLLTTAQPLLGCLPRLTAVLADKRHRHHASTTWPSGPSSRVDWAVPNARSRSCSKRARSESGTAARTNSTRLARSGSVTGSSTLTTGLPRRPPSVLSSATGPARVTLMPAFVCRLRGRERGCWGRAAPRRLTILGRMQRPTAAMLGEPSLSDRPGSLTGK